MNYTEEIIVGCYILAKGIVTVCYPYAIAIAGWEIGKRIIRRLLRHLNED